MSFVPQTSFFLQSLNFEHRGFTVRWGFQECNPRQRRWYAVLEIFLDMVYSPTTNSVITR
jgi:hypothetical protein